MTESQNCEDKGINTRALAFVLKIVLSNKAKHKHHLQVWFIHIGLVSVNMRGHWRLHYIGNIAEFANPGSAAGH